MKGLSDFRIETRNKQFLPYNDENERRWDGSFFFVQAADTQFGMYESYILKNEVNPGWGKEIAWSKQLVEDVNKMNPRPKFMVVCGDLLDAFPQTRPDLRQLQEVDFKKVFAELQIPLVCVCGNHDIGNEPDYEAVDLYRSSFGDDFFSFWCGGVFFIVINSQYYESCEKVPLLAEEQETWLEEQLKAVRRLNPIHIVVFQHIPYFVREPDEAKQFFNIEPNLRKSLLERLYSAGCRHVFTGHFHRNAGGAYKDMQQIVTSAAGVQLGDSLPGYRVVEVYQWGIKHGYYALGQGPSAVSLSGPQMMENDI